MEAKPHFIQIHSLHSYPAALLNRDDAGLAKRLPMGGTTRTRISSQCLKRHWRMADDRYALAGLDVPMAVRSRDTLLQIRDRIVANGISEENAQAAVETMRDSGLVDKAGKAQTGDAALQTGQAVLLGKTEIDYLVSRCTALARENGEESALREAVKTWITDKAEKKNIEAMKHGSGLESALFGRMVTSDVLASRDASVYVGHSFTVHQAEVENDYFTVVDDLLQESGGLGSAGIFDTELASGLYYGYVVVDVRQLVENLEGIDGKQTFADSTPEGQRELAGRIVKHILHLVATVSPGAKRGSTAPFSWAKFMLVEAGDWQPRSLASAFHDALPLDAAESSGVLTRALERISNEVKSLDDAYGMLTARRFLALDDTELPAAQRKSLADIGAWAEEVIHQGYC